jgi:hypothetical protein
MTRYFNRFPLVDYNGTPAKNILARVDFTDQTKKDIYVNFDYVLQEGSTRPDILSFNYYNSTQYDWLIYMTNNIIDPYHDYYKSQDDFKNYIVGKYGTAEIARSKILFYRNDWAPDESLITETVYDSLSTVIKKYWKPKINTTNQINGYERIKEDWVVSTNRIVQLTVTADISGFIIGDTINQTSTDASGILVSKDDAAGILIVQHVDGAYAVSTVDGIASVIILKENISTLEASFWAPVYAYEYEEEQNELKKYISLIKSSYVPDVEKSFIEQLKK